MQLQHPGAHHAVPLVHKLGRGSHQQEPCSHLRPRDGWGSIRPRGTNREQEDKHAATAATHVVTPTPPMRGYETVGCWTALVGPVVITTSSDRLDTTAPEYKRASSGCFGSTGGRASFEKHSPWKEEPLPYVNYVDLFQNAAIVNSYVPFVGSSKSIHIETLAYSSFVSVPGALVVLWMKTKFP